MIRRRSSTVYLAAIFPMGLRLVIEDSKIDESQAAADEAATPMKRRLPLMRLNRPQLRVESVAAALPKAAKERRRS